MNGIISKANSIPGVDFPHIPSIPALAKGGIVPATPGGRIVRVAEAGKAEAIVPLDEYDRRRGGGGDGPQVKIDVHPAAGTDEVTTAMMVARRFAALAVR
ncbi:hypothetical protein [Dactylosporangium sp. NPDC051484]|uniref:hypothetical protein n=1 Tax=Dactylosporangium sp. NPDC051484 TaxID=3154942 RepID=UPI00344D32B7